MRRSPTREAPRKQWRSRRGRSSSYTSLGSTTVQLADATDDYAVVQFNVPAGQARLDGSIAYQAAGPSTDFTAGDSLTLISPSGQLALYSLPQGAGNFGDAQVANPAPGKWTALILGFPTSEGGTAGPVQFAASTATWVPFGTLSASSVHLPAGRLQDVCPFRQHAGDARRHVRLDRHDEPGRGHAVLRGHHDGAGDPAFADPDAEPVDHRDEDADGWERSPVQLGTDRLLPGQRSDRSGRVLNASISTPNAANTFWAS